MPNGIDVSKLPAYVEQNRELLLAGSIIGAKTLDYITIQTGVKTNAAVNVLTTKVVLGDGTDCGWTENSSSEFSQRQINTGLVQVAEGFCEKKLLGKWTEHDVRIAAGREKLPFEEKFLQGLADATADEVDRTIWQGDTEEMSDESLKRFDGFIKILGAEEKVVKFESAEAAGAFAIVQGTLKKLPAKALKGEVRMFCSPSFLMEYGQELVTKNLYHFEPGKDYDSFVIPGSKVILTAVEGLENTKTNRYLITAQVENLFYGCDMADDKEVYDFWFSKDDRKWKYDCEFNAGVQVAFPERVVLTTITPAS